MTGSDTSGMLFLIVVIAIGIQIAISFAVANIAESKGREVAVWVILSLITWLTLPIILMLSSKAPQRSYADIQRSRDYNERLSAMAAEARNR